MLLTELTSSHHAPVKRLSRDESALGAQRCQFLLYGMCRVSPANCSKCHHRHKRCQSFRQAFASARLNTAGTSGKQHAPSNNNDKNVTGLFGLKETERDKSARTDRSCLYTARARRQLPVRDNNGNAPSPAHWKMGTVKLPVAWPGNLSRSAASRRFIWPATAAGSQSSPQSCRGSSWWPPELPAPALGHGRWGLRHSGW